MLGTMSVPRFLYRFTDANNAEIFNFPLISPDYEWEPSQDLRVPFTPVSGAHYGFNMRSGKYALKDVGRERVRFSLYNKCGPTELDSKLDAMKGYLYNGKTGKIWTRDANFNKRWAWATLVSMPEHTIIFTPSAHKILPMICEFRRESNWYNEVVISDTAPATGTVVVNNPGNAPNYEVRLTLRGTYTNPIITNTTNGYIFATNRDGSSNSHRVRMNAGTNEVLFSSDGGVIYNDDYANYIRQAGQVQLMVLEPGDNEFTFSGVSSGVFAWFFFPGWH